MDAFLINFKNPISLILLKTFKSIKKCFNWRYNILQIEKKNKTDDLDYFRSVTFILRIIQRFILFNKIKNIKKYY
jgi:hypothetical protein